MSAISRRVGVNFTVFFVLGATLFYYFWPVWSSTSGSRSDVGSVSRPWEYNFPRDANNHGLSVDQCSVAFPDFYSDIDSAVASRKNDLVQPAELDIQDNFCMVRVLIFDAQIYIIQGRQNENCWIGRWHERTSGLLHSIQQAISSAPPGSIPNAEFVLNLDDDPQRPIEMMDGSGSNRTSVWGLTRLEEQRHIWLMPDYAYWAWPSALVASHTHIRRKMMEVSAEFPWESKISKAVWRGTTHLNPEIRESLIKTTESTIWADVKVCDIYVPETKQYCITQDQHCQYKFPIHTEGYTYSGRLKYLQLCNSAPIAHHLKWIEHHHHLMRPSGPRQNFIQVQNDWSDLQEKVTYFLQHEEEAKKIASNSYETFYERYLTPAGTSCYWRRLITSWAHVQGFVPQLYKYEPGSGKKVLRGIPFEAYVIDAKHPMPDI